MTARSGAASQDLILRLIGSIQTSSKNPTLRLFNEKINNETI
ncbi:hypothetical protein DYBT9275_02610 [Dyadobacter sp. CECT 9275]|uniref:Uncharacterized protein n=1 Tax=Dyadobacter helix TaxID=2822344 RepID=A0A916JBN1_9BACT|nr:hypothetical protein DYBT9275_02610 [Dyadobacter sp. CECT 9275]